MWFAHFECIVAGENASRFYRYEIATDILGTWYIDFIWGRIGRSELRRRRSDPDGPASLGGLLAKEARERFKHGYRLTDANLPPAVFEQVDSARPRATKSAKINARRAEKLARAREVLAQMPGQTERISQIDRLLDRIEPTRKRARSSVRRKRRRASNDLFAHFATAALTPAPRDIDEEEVETRRQVFRTLAAELLDDDPLVARSVLRSLDQPKPYEPQSSNVVQLRPVGRRLHQWSVRQFIYQGYLRGQDPPRPDFGSLQATLAQRLVDNAIETVADLLAADIDGLVARGILSEREVRGLSRALADYDLRLTIRPPEGSPTRRLA